MRIGVLIACASLLAISVSAACNGSPDRTAGGGVEGVIPDGARKLSGRIVLTDAFLHGREPVRFGSSHYVLGETHFVTLDSVLARTDMGPTQWASLDVAVAQLRDGEVLAFACGVDSPQPDGITFAAVAETGDEEYGLARRAWQVTMDSLRIVEIAPQGVRCINEAWGV